ncbi:MAG: hypothetical protein CVU84_02230 [Firmicutes bacterium HGW-Firmicutes-1]|nr:MAG: hypothetical protein CVU84_02230 [Firmicutes bacterium HGW-Firmicutes-1]
MAWCQRCEYEYEEYVKKCTECGDELVSNLTEDNKKTQNNYEYSILMNVANTMEADLIISQLEAYSIPSYKGYQSSGGYLNIAAGFNYQGTDIFVPKVFLDEAREIVTENQSNIIEDMNAEEVKELEEFEREFNDKRNSRVSLFFIIVVVIPILLALLYNLLEFV